MAWAVFANISVICIRVHCVLPRVCNLTTERHRTTRTHSTRSRALYLWNCEQTRRGRGCGGGGHLFPPSRLHVLHVFFQRVGGELQARVQGEFLALQQLLQDEEACLQEQLRREQEEVLEQLQRHLELLQSSVKELEENIMVLTQAAAAADYSILTEVNARGMCSSYTAGTSNTQCQVQSQREDVFFGSRLQGLIGLILC